MIVALRQAQNFNKHTQDKLYGIVKTYELDIQQEIAKGSRKKKTMALIAEKADEQGNVQKTVTTKATPSMEAFGGRADAGKEIGKLVEEDDESSIQIELDILMNIWPSCVRNSSRPNLRETLQLLDNLEEVLNQNDQIWLKDQKIIATIVVQLGISIVNAENKRKSSSTKNFEYKKVF